MSANMEKRIKNIPRAEVMSDFVKESIQNKATIFGGAVRDMITGVEPTDIDIYFNACDLKTAEKTLKWFIESMPNWTFERLLETEEDDNWSYYSNSASYLMVAPFLVTYGEIQFKVDIVIRHPELDKLDCIVNGLVMDSSGISFTNFEHKKLQKLKKEERVELAKQLIIQRKAGMFPGCDIHRIEKMKLKGYNTDLFE